MIREYHSWILHLFHDLLFSPLMSAAQKKSSVFGVIILLSVLFVAWLHISDDMIILQMSLVI